MIDPRSAAQKNDLTADKFEGLLLRLDSDRDRAGWKYEEIRWKLIKFFQWSACVDAEHLADETLNRVAEKLVTRNQEIGNVAGFAWGVAKKIRQEAVRLHSRTIPFSGLPGGEDRITGSRSGGVSANESSAGDKRLGCLRGCIQHLGTEDRKLLLTYHSPSGRRIEGRQRLAQENGITMVALRVRANRLRFKLEECIKKCLAAKPC